MKKFTLRDELDSLDALISAETDDANVALNRLASLADPVSIRRKLALLNRENRIADALAEISTRSPHQEWLELGIRIAIRAGDFARAREYIAFSNVQEDTSGTLTLRAALAFADSALGEQLKTQITSSTPRSAFAIDPALLPILEEALTRLTPFCEGIVERSPSFSPVQWEALTVQVLLLGLLGRGESARSTMRALCVNSTMHTHVGLFVLEGRLPLVDHLSDALMRPRSEDIFFSRLAGVLIAQEERPDVARTFGQLTEMVSFADEQQRGPLFSAIAELASSAGEPFIERVEVYQSKLLDLTKPEHAARLASFQLGRGETHLAEATLDNASARTDPLWLRTRSRVDFALGREQIAVEVGCHAALLFLDDRWLEDAAVTAFQHKSVSKSLECLRAIKHYYPWRTTARLNLARLSWQQGDHDEAIAEYEYVVEKRPDDSGLKTELGQRYLDTDRAKDAKRMLDDVCSAAPPPLPALLVRAVAMRRLGDAQGAFSSLHAVRNLFWGSKDFLFTYMELAYAVDREQHAREALAELTRLRQRGEIDSTVMWEASIEDLLEHGRVFDEQQKVVNGHIIRGEAPWAMACIFSRRPLIAEWAMRTQPLRWVGEDVQTRAHFSVYATNGFTVGQANDENRLTEIVAAMADVVCIDYSALLTLHQLRCMPLLAKAYKNIVVPSDYRSRVAGEVARLQPHQASRKNGYQAIRVALDKDRLKLADQDTQQSMPSISEYSLEGETPTTRPLSTLTDLLIKGGHVTNDVGKRLRAVSRRTDSGAPLKDHDSVIIDVSTLMTVFTEGGFDAALSALQLHLTEEDRKEVLGDLTSFERQEELHRDLKTLWDSIATLPTIQFKSKPGALGDTEEDQIKGKWTIASLGLAESLDLALIVDDRSLQAAMLNKRGTTDAAFGSDALLKQFYAKGLIDIAQYSSSLLQLLRWRYRFLLLDAEVLKELAARYEGMAPGRDLVDVARYIHDCMMDPGLFGGLERSNPPSSMALRLYLSWSSRLGDFLALVWTDSSISDERAKALTEWVATTMLPEVPIVVPVEQQSRMATLVRETPFLNALLRAGEFPPRKRVAENLALLAEHLTISARRVEVIVAEVASHVTAQSND